MTRNFPVLLIITALVVAVLTVLPTQAQSPLPVTGTVDAIANLRTGPGTANALAGQTQPGQTVTVIEVSAGGDWFKLDSGSWIHSSLVNLAGGIPAAALLPPPIAAPISPTITAPVESLVVTSTTTTVPAGSLVLTDTTVVTPTVATMAAVTPTNQIAAQVTVTVKKQANLRSGPGTSYAKVGSAAPGSTLVVAGRTADGQWLKLAMNAWVYAALVSPVPATLPVVDGQATPAATTLP